MKLLKTQNSKVNNLEKKISDATALIHINQYSTGKQNLAKKIEDVVKKIPDTRGLHNCFEYKN